MRKAAEERKSKKWARRGRHQHQQHQKINQKMAKENRNIGGGIVSAASASGIMAYVPAEK